MLSKKFSVFIILSLASSFAHATLCTPLLEVRSASSADVPAMVELDRAAWGEAMAADSDKLLSRIDTFKEGQLVILSDGTILGFVNSQKISSTIKYIGEQGTWPAVTGHGFIKETHKSEGSVLFLINITVDTSIRSKGFKRSLVGGELIKHLLKIAKTQNIVQVEGITRLNGFKSYLQKNNLLGSYSHHSLTQVNEYIQKVRIGEVRDPALSFHLDQGARVVGPIKNAMPEDHDSLLWGALIVYQIE